MTPDQMAVLEEIVDRLDRRLDRIEEKVDGIVTWKALGAFAVGFACFTAAVIGVAFSIVDHA